MFLTKLCCPVDTIRSGQHCTVKPKFYTTVPTCFRSYICDMATHKRTSSSNGTWLKIPAQSKTY